MRRNTFLKIGATAILTPLVMKLHAFAKWVDEQPAAGQMPVMFVGHGNPMNAILKNEFSEKWKALGEQLPRPKAILTVSAHWLTRGTYVTAMERPRTIHDFGGFPEELFKQQYAVPGAVDMAEETRKIVTKTTVHSDYEWGLDHGTWSVLLPMYPKADIPVFQLSIDYSKPPRYHYELAQELAALRKKGVLIMGSGNIVHNLRMIDFEGKRTFDWAVEFDEKIKGYIDEGNHDAVIDYDKLGTLASLAVPTSDHYLPLMYTLGLRGKNEEVIHFNDKMDAGSISMRSLLIGS